MQIANKWCKASCREFRLGISGSFFGAGHKEQCKGQKALAYLVRTMCDQHLFIQKPWKNSFWQKKDPKFKYEWHIVSPYHGVWQWGSTFKIRSALDFGAEESFEQTWQLLYQKIDQTLTKVTITASFFWWRGECKFCIFMCSISCGREIASENF